LGKGRPAALHRRKDHRLAFLKRPVNRGQVGIEGDLSGFIFRQQTLDEAVGTAPDVLEVRRFEKLGARPGDNRVHIGQRKQAVVVVRILASDLEHLVLPGVAEKRFWLNGPDQFRQIESGRRHCARLLVGRLASPPGAADGEAGWLPNATPMPLRRAGEQGRVGQRK
jgi:hypothetical protein